MSWWPWGKKARERKTALEAELEGQALETSQKIRDLAALYVKEAQFDPYKSTGRARNTGQSLQGIAWHHTAMAPRPDPMQAIKMLRDEFEHHRACWTTNEQAYNNQIAELKHTAAEQEECLSDMQNEIDALKAGVVLD